LLAGTGNWLKINMVSHAGFRGKFMQQNAKFLNEIPKCYHYVQGHRKIYTYGVFQSQNFGVTQRSFLSETVTNRPKTVLPTKPSIARTSSFCRHVSSSPCFLSSSSSSYRASWLISGLSINEGADGPEPLGTCSHLIKTTVHAKTTGFHGGGNSHSISSSDSSPSDVLDNRKAKIASGPGLHEFFDHDQKKNKDVLPLLVNLDTTIPYVEKTDIGGQDRKGGSCCRCTKSSQLSFICKSCFINAQL
jgi:hypothetical protein